MSTPDSFYDELISDMALDIFCKRKKIKEYVNTPGFKTAGDEFKLQISKLASVNYSPALIFNPIVTMGYDRMLSILQVLLIGFQGVTGLSSRNKVVQAFLLRLLMTSGYGDENQFTKSTEVLMNAEALQLRVFKTAGIDRAGIFEELLEIIRSGENIFNHPFEMPEEPVQEKTAESKVEHQEIPEIQQDVRDEIVEVKNANVMEIYPQLKQLEESLASQGLLEELKKLNQWPPVHEFTPEDGSGPKVLYAESAFFMREGRSCRNAMVVYVDCGIEGYKPRFIYGSTTHIAIKSLPRAIVNSEGKIVLFDKADSEDSISLKMPYQIELIERISSDEDIVELTKDRMDEFVSRLVRAVSVGNAWKDQYRHDTFFAKVAPKSAVIPVSRTIPKTENTIRIADDYARPEEVHLKDANKQYDALRDADRYLPTKFLKKTKIRTLKYGEVDVFFFQSTHPINATNYMVCRVQLPKTYKGNSTHGLMIATMDPAHEQANTYLTSEEYLDIDGITVPMLEKHQMISRIGDESLMSGNAFLNKFDCENSGNPEGDFIMWNYLKRLPVIQAFAHKGVEAMMA